MESVLEIDGRINREIASDEKMRVEGDVSRYFNVGRSALESILAGLEAAQIPVANVRRILDIPCGHGRVLRYLRAAFPNAQISACDIMRDGVDYCSTTFGAAAVYSEHEPEQIPLENDAFDLVWVGSLFTHLDAELWPRFLARFSASLRVGGAMIFSAHGYNVYRWMATGHWQGDIPHTADAVVAAYEQSGFGYSRYQGSKSYYGMSLSHPSWVISTINKVPGLRLAHFRETMWDNNHDCYTCVRDSSPAKSTRRMSWLPWSG